MVVHKGAWYIFSIFGSINGISFLIRRNINIGNSLIENCSTYVLVRINVVFSERSLFMKRPTVYDYLDYRSYLGDMYYYRKESASSFSYRFFSNKAGFASPNFLKLVVNGQRNLTNASIAKVAKGFGLKKKERDFFENLVFMNQATAHDEKNYYYRKMISIVGYKNIPTLSKDQYAYFSNWYYPAIREMVRFGSGDLSAQQMAALLNPKIKVTEAEAALKCLKKLRLIKQNDDGLWLQYDRDISTGPEIRELIIANFHKEMLRLATESIDRFPASERDISAVTLSIRRENLAEFKARLVSFRRELMELASLDEDPDRVVQINLQLFPLTK